MRIRLCSEDRRQFFTNIKLASNLPYKDIADILHISVRTLRAWRSGTNSIPFTVGEKIKTKFGIAIPSPVQIIDDREVKKLAGSKGARARYSKYGNPGTMEGRKKGGYKSLESHNRDKTGFRLLKHIHSPDESAEFAEFIGIMLGDGGISNYQVHVTLNRTDDREYAVYVRELMFRLFHDNPSLKERRKNNTIEVVLSSKNLVDFLKRKGLVVGDKIRQGISFPEWISSNEMYAKSAIRGLFDTDGCIYQDIHRYKDRVYRNPGIAITSYSDPLLDNIHEILNSQGFMPTKSTKHRIMIRKRREVQRFFDIIRSNNSKHILRFKQFMEG